MLPTTTTGAVSAFLHQVLPLIVLFVVPALALRLLAFLRPRLMAFGSILPRLWLWGSPTSIPASENEKDSCGKKHNRRARTRAEQQQLLAGGSRGEDVYFPGLVNMSGTHCFMNSTLQALAALSHLPPYLHAIRTRAEALDVPTPVVDALIDLLAALNTPTSTQTPLRAVALVEALCTPPPPLSNSSSSTSPYSSSLTSGSAPTTSAASILSAFWSSGTNSTSTAGGASKKATALLASHEHQDAQELFQLLSECVREEGARVWRERGSASGFASSSLGLDFGASSLALDSRVTGIDFAMTGIDLPPQSPFDGLTATRRACVRCGYTAAIRHFAFDSVQLALDLGGGTPLSALLRAYTAPEVLQDCPCRRCELRATGRRLQEEVRRLEAAASSSSVEGQVNGHVHEGMIVTANGRGSTLGADPVDGGEEDGETKETKSKTKKSKKKHRSGKEKSQQHENDDGEGASTGIARHRRLKTVRRLEARVRRALDAGRIEEEELVGEWGDWGGGDTHALGDEDTKQEAGGDQAKERESMLLRGTGDALKGVKMERVAGGVCTRQSMFGRAPPILALHLNRSVHTGYRVAKNGAFVAFPEILDMTPYATGGEMSSDFGGVVDAYAAREGGKGGGEGPESEREKGRGRCLYRLAAVVCHYGAHSFGHYVCYRRAPVGVSSSSSSAPASSSAAPPFTSSSPSSTYTPAPPSAYGSSGTGTGWLRISDARVERCGVEQVLAEGSAAFMLYYERVVEDSGGSSSSPALSATALAASRMAGAPTSSMAASTAPSTPLNEEAEAVGDSAETIRPAPSPSASTSTSASTPSAAVPFPGEEKRDIVTTLRARVVRSVSLRRGSGSRLGAPRMGSALVGGGLLASSSSASPSPSVSLAGRDEPGAESGAAMAAQVSGDGGRSASASGEEGEDGWERVESLAVTGTVSPTPPPSEGALPAPHDDSENVSTPNGKPKNKRKKKGAAGRQQEFLKAISVN